MSQGGVDVESFARDGLLAFGLKVLERAHIVEAVGQLDEHDAHIGNHGQKHLANVLGLPILTVGKLDLVDLGDALDDVGHLVAKGRFDLFIGGGGVFDGVVQQPCRDGCGVELHLGQDFGDLERMNDVGLARSAQLAVVVLNTELPCLSDEGDVFIGTVGLNVAKQSLKARIDGGADSRGIGLWRSFLHFPRGGRERAGIICRNFLPDSCHASL